MAADKANPDAISSSEAYEILSNTSDSVLIDVRTRAEWSFVGLPDLSGIGRPLWLVEWVEFPSMAPNPRFLDRLDELMAEHQPGRLLFLCRSGGRSMAAAMLVSREMAARGRPLPCTNVADGFEGDLDAQGHRGTQSGWKAAGLPWGQN